jgi:hypothetical protein
VEKLLTKRGPVYAAPTDRENLNRGVFLTIVLGASIKDSPRHRQRAFEAFMTQFEEGVPPFNADDCFCNGLSEHDLIYIPQFSSHSDISHSDLATMRDSNSATHQTPEQHDIIVAASELIELAKLKVDLSKAYLDAQQYKDLVFKVVSVEAGHLTEEECQLVSQKNFAKSIKALAEARMKVSQWYEASSGKHELILNELSFMDDEPANPAAESTASSAESPNGQAKPAPEAKTAAIA